MAKGHYLIYDTCPDLYKKIIARIVKQLKRDGTPYTTAELPTTATHSKACNRINYKGVDAGGVRKVKACETCKHKPVGKLERGRNISNKMTMISIMEG